MGEEFFGGQATTIVLLLLLSSFQLFFLFIIGQYVARIYDESRDRPLYVVASTAGLGEAPVANQPGVAQAARAAKDKVVADLVSEVAGDARG